MVAKYQYTYSKHRLCHNTDLCKCRGIMAEVLHYFCSQAMKVFFSVFSLFLPNMEFHPGLPWFVYQPQSCSLVWHPAPLEGAHPNVAPEGAGQGSQGSASKGVPARGSGAPNCSKAGKQTGPNSHAGSLCPSLKGICGGGHQDFLWKPWTQKFAEIMQMSLFTLITVQSFPLSNWPKGQSFTALSSPVNIRTKPSTKSSWVVQDLCLLLLSFLSSLHFIPKYDLLCDLSLKDQHGLDSQFWLPRQESSPLLK